MLFMNAAEMDVRDGRYYHLSDALLAPGSRIEPGAFGRKLMIHTRRGGCDMVFREYVLEAIRRTEFPRHPSRLEAVFLFETQKDLTAYLAKEGAHWQFSYQVRLVDDQAPVFRADWTKVAPGPDEPILPRMEPLAREYWTGDPDQHCEVLTLSAVEVVDRFHHLSDSGPFPQFPTRQAS